MSRRRSRTVRIVELKRRWKRLLRGAILLRSCIELQYRNPMHDEEIRLVLQKRLRRKNIDRLWKHLKSRGYVDEVTDGFATIADLVEQSRDILAAGIIDRASTGGAVQPDGPTAGQERRWALSQIVAAEMTKGERVTGFRRDHLEGGLIKWPEAQSWIQRCAAADGPSTTDLTVTIPHSRLDYNGRGEARLDPPLERMTAFKVSRESLEYAVPGSDWVLHVPVSSGGVLDQLRRLSEWLASKCTWMSAQATIFVLSGVVPLISSVRTTTTVVSSNRKWAARIVLDIDPAATPDEVLRVYQAVREGSGLAHRRTITPRLARLAAFATAEHAELPWKERQRLWNEKFPDWRYDQASNFRRDALAGRQRLLCDDITPEGTWPPLT